MNGELATIARSVARSPRKLTARVAVALLGAIALCVMAAPTSHAATRVLTASQVCASVGSRAGSQSVCRVIPAGGTFTLPIPGTAAVITGVGTPDRAGKAIVISRAPLVCPKLGGFGIQLSTSASEKVLPPLHWTNGTLYYRDRTTGQCVGVQSPALAAAPGLYQVVPAVGVTAMPRTGGAMDRAASSYPRLAAVAVLCLLMGAMILASRRVRRIRSQL